MPSKEAAGGNRPVTSEGIATGDLDTFTRLLLSHAKVRGDRPAIREKNRGIWSTMTWRDLADEAAALAIALSERGLERGAHIALIGDNRPGLLSAMCAAHWLGAVATPLYQDATADEIASPIQSAGATHVFAENQEQVDKLLEILPRCPTVQWIIYDEDRGMRHYAQSQVVSYAALLQEGRSISASKSEALKSEAARGAGEDAAFLFFTSGVSGPPKGVVLTHAALIDRARTVAAMEGLSEADVTMAYLPPGWICQTLFSYVQPMVVGCCVCCPESSETMLADTREIGPTCFLAPPRVLDALLTQMSMRAEDAGGFNRGLYRRCITLAQRVARRSLDGETPTVGDRMTAMAGDLLIYGPLRDVLGMSRVRVAYTAGDAISPDLLMFYRAIGINLKQLYGSTETGFFVAMHRNGQVKPETVGPAIDGVEVKLTQEREILVRSLGSFREYHRDPETTVKARDCDGWFHTGDAGEIGGDGHLRIIDRLEDVGALSDGTPYAPKPIENRLRFLPYIKEAVAFGDGRDMVCALIDIDVDPVARWADNRSISYTGAADLAAHDEVLELIAAGIAEVNSKFASEPTLARTQVHRFAILQRELSADDGELTRTGKLRRGAIAERYKPLIDAMYDGSVVVQLDGEGGHPAPADVKIGDAKVAVPAQVGRAA